MPLSVIAIGALMVLAAQEIPAATRRAVAWADDRQLRASRRNRNDFFVRGHGFVRDADGEFTVIDVPRATVSTIAFGIDESGRTVGSYVDARGRTHGFQQKRREVSSRPSIFPVPPRPWFPRSTRMGRSSAPTTRRATQPPCNCLMVSCSTKAFSPRSISQVPRRLVHSESTAAVEIVGEYLDAGNAIHGFLLDNGVFTTIDVPGGASTAATDIDDSGRIVGFSTDPHGEPARIPPRPRTAHSVAIDVPDAAATQPFGINNHGQIVGFFSTPRVEERRKLRGFVLDNGVFTTVDVPDARPRTVILDINDQGQLAGASDLIVAWLRSR